MTSILCAFVVVLIFGTLCNGAPSTVYERCLSHANSMSARRLPNETYHQILEKIPKYCTASYEHPVNQQKPLHELDIDQIPEVSLEELEQEFKFIRDTRFIEDTNGFPRRASWMYPDDGCHARAEFSAHKLIGHNFVKPKKIFAFGDLVAKTENHPDGVVTWWYHVVVGYRVGETVYVIDPSLNPHKLLTLIEWAHAMGVDEATVNFSICHHFTFIPYAYCYKPDPINTELEAEEHQRFWFLPEWGRLEEMGRNPEEELGDNPPWL